MFLLVQYFQHCTQQTICLSLLILEPPISSVFLKALLHQSQVTLNSRCRWLTHSSAKIQPNLPTQSLKISPKQPKNFVSAHTVVYINSLNFICINLVHHLLGMLYKEDEKYSSKCSYICTIESK